MLPMDRDIDNDTNGQEIVQHDYRYRYKYR